MNKPNNPSSECSNCGCSTSSDHRWVLLHHVRLRGIYRRLCASCVLKLHPGSFCPTCFDLFDTSPPHHRRVICQKCPSISHPTCVPSTEKPYTCPPCSDPNFSFFDIKKTKEEVGDGKEVRWVIDKKAARVLLCAARIAAVSMSKAVVVARAEAERRVREAALCRKRAREALEHVAIVAAKEKAKRKEASVEGSGSGSVHVGVKENNCKGNGGVVGGVAEQNRIEGRVDGVMDSSCEVSANLNRLGLREKERVQGFSAKNTVLGSPKNGVTVAVEDEERQKVSNADGLGRLEFQNHGIVKEESSELTNIDGNNAEGEKVKNGLFSVPSVGGQLQHLENSYGRNEDDGSK